MAITDSIPLPNTGMSEFLKQLQLGAENRQKQQELEQTGQYRQAQMDIQRQTAQRLKEEAPLKYALLQAQIEGQRALAKKRNADANMSSGLTKANVTTNQKVIQAIDNVVPILKELEDPKYKVPNQLFGQYLHPDLQKNYIGKTAKIVDSLAAALSLPKTNESLDLVKSIIRRGTFESDKAYRGRITEELTDLANRRGRAQQSIKEGISGGESSEDVAADKNWVINENGELVEG